MAKVSTARQQQRANFGQCISRYATQGGAILSRWTIDDIYVVSGAPFSDIIFHYVAKNQFVTEFVPGDRYKCFCPADRKHHVAEYLGWFPTEKGAQDRADVLQRDGKKSGVQGKRSSAVDPQSRSKKPKENQSGAPLPQKPLTFQERLRMNGVVFPGGESATKPVAKEHLVGSSFCDLSLAGELPENDSGIGNQSSFTGNSVLSPDSFDLKYSAMPPSEPSSSYHQLAGSHAGAVLCPAASVDLHHSVGKATDLYSLCDLWTTDGGWTSQSELVETVAREVENVEYDRDNHRDAAERICVQLQQESGLPEDDIYVPSDADLFRDLALAYPPLVEDGPTRNSAIVSFPRASLEGAPDFNGPQAGNIPSLLVKNTGNKGQRDITVLSIPKITDIADLIKPGQPIKFKDHRWKWPQLGAPSEEYYIPLRTNEREFTFKNPRRVNRSSITLRDQSSPWFFQLDGPDKMKLDCAFPSVFVDKDCHLLDAAFLNRKLSAEKYSWYLMSRLIGGAPGLIRLGTLYEMKKEQEEKRPYKFFESVLGIEFFRAVEKKMTDLVRAMVPDAEAGREAVNAALKTLPTLPSTMQSHLTHKFTIWMDNFKTQHEKRERMAKQ